MGLATVIPSADFSSLNIGNSLFPVTSGLVGLFYPGADAATTTKNYAPGGGAASIVGSPVYGSNFATFNNNSPGAAYLSIATPLTGEYTIVTIAKEVDGSADSYVFAQTGANTFAYLSQTGSSRFASFPQSQNFDMASADMLNVDSAKFALYGFRRAATAGSFTQAFNGSVRTRTETFFTARSASSGALAIGAYPASPNAGTGDRTIDIAAVAVFNRYLTDAEMLKVSKGLATIMKYKGIHDL